VEKKRGLLITFEGIEGCGKSTAIHEAQHYLSERGRNALLTREPGGTWLGESLRAIILDTPKDQDIDAIEEAFLFCASRAAHTRKIIGPALAAGYDVVSDRYLDSTFVYQGVQGGLEDADLDLLNRIATRGIKPNLTILLDLPAEMGLARKRGDGEMNRIDRKNLAFHKMVRERFLELAAVEPDRIRIVDSSGARDATAAGIRNCLAILLEKSAN